MGIYFFINGTNILLLKIYRIHFFLFLYQAMSVSFLTNFYLIVRIMMTRIKNGSN